MFHIGFYGRTLAVALAILAASGCKPECTDADGHYCEGTKIFTCDDYSGEWNHLDCGDYGQVCVEASWSDGVEFAGCVLSSDPCPGGVVSMCFDDQVAYCYLGYPTCIEEPGSHQVLATCELCADSNEVCVEGNSGGAFCAYSDEPCEPDEGPICHPTNPKWVLKCSDGYWDFTTPCLGETSCVELPDGGIDCQ